MRTLGTNNSHIVAFFTSMIVNKQQGAQKNKNKNKNKRFTIAWTCKV